MDSATLRFALRTAGFVDLTLGLLVGFEIERALASSDSRRQEVTYRWMQRYGRGLLRLYGVEVSTIGAHIARPWGRYPARDERGLGRLFVMNHRSMLDIFVNLAFVEANIVSRADLARWPVIGLAARRVGTLFVDRRSRRSGVLVLQAMCAALERGRGVIVYPEGTTFPGDAVRPFHSGAFVAAKRTGAEIVPMGIAYGGSSAAYVDEPFVNHLRRVASTPRTRVGLVVGDPLRGVATSSETVHEHVQSLVHRARSLVAAAASGHRSEDLNDG